MLPPPFNIITSMLSPMQYHFLNSKSPCSPCGTIADILTETILIGVTCIYFHLQLMKTCRRLDRFKEWRISFYVSSILVAPVVYVGVVLYLYPLAMYHKATHVLLVKNTHEGHIMEYGDVVAVESSAATEDQCISTTEDVFNETSLFTVADLNRVFHKVLPADHSASEKYICEFVKGEVSASADKLNERLDAAEELRKKDQRMDKIDIKLKEMDQKMDDLYSKLDRMLDILQLLQRQQQQ